MATNDRVNHGFDGPAKPETDGECIRLCLAVLFVIWIYACLAAAAATAVIEAFS